MIFLSKWVICRLIVNLPGSFHSLKTNMATEKNNQPWTMNEDVSPIQKG